MVFKKRTSREKRKIRIRKKILGTSSCPRMSVFRSNKHLYVQLIDDINHKTLASASTLKDNKGTNKEAAKWLGETIADKSLASKIEQVVFDRNGFRYHGVIKQIADSAREKGLKF